MRERNLEIINNTLELCNTDEYLVNAVKKSLVEQKIYKENLKFNNKKSGEACKIIVSKKRSLEASSSYKDYNVGILNFASFTKPGGGVLNGSTAQEEAVCRCSTLYPCLAKLRDTYYSEHRELLNTEKLDSFYNSDCIYTPGVVVFKDDIDANLLPRDEWYSINVISCAAPNLRSMSKVKRANIPVGRLMDMYKYRIRRILSIAKEHNIEVLILGAFGCGVFCNSPKLMAKAFKQVLEEFKYDFKIIEFAVYCSEKNTTNYDNFKTILEG